MPTPIPDPPCSLSSIKDLSPDLVAATNSALVLTHSARIIHDFGCAGNAQLVAAGVEALDREFNDCQAAILKVMKRLTEWREGKLFECGELIETNAHYAAVTLTHQVLDRLWNAVDLLAWSRCLVDESARMNRTLIPKRIKAIAKYFRTFPRPDFERLIKSIEAEAVQADKWHGARPSQVQRQNGKPKVQRANDPRNKWIYQQARKNMPYQTIADKTRALAAQKGWGIISSKQAAYQIAMKYADDHGLPKPPPRQNN